MCLFFSICPTTRPMAGVLHRTWERPVSSVKLLVWTLLETAEGSENTKRHAIITQPAICCCCKFISPPQFADLRGSVFPLTVKTTASCFPCDAVMCWWGFCSSRPRSSPEAEARYSTGRPEEAFDWYKGLRWRERASGSSILEMESNCGGSPPVCTTMLWSILV